MSVRHRFKLQQDAVEKMLAALRTSPGNVRGAAKLCGLDHRTVQKAWDLGFYNAPDHLAWLRRPIREIIAEEQVELRARMVREREKAESLEAELESKRRQEVRVAAMVDATDTRKHELQLSRMARTAAMQTLATITNVAAGVAKVGQQVRAALDRLADADPTTGQPKQLSPSEMANMMKLLGTLATCLRQANDAGRTAVEIERLIAGEPTSIVGHYVTSGPMSLADAEARISRASKALERAKRAGVVFDNGPLLHPVAPGRLGAGGGDGAEAGAVEGGDEGGEGSVH